MYEEIEISNFHQSKSLLPAMTKSFINKRLLILGQSMATLDIIRYAQSKGVYVVFADNIDPALSCGKKIADEYWNVSTADIEALEMLSLKNNVSAVFAGISEFNIKSAMTLCERLNLPFYCTSAQWEILSKKQSFKQLCRDHDVPVVEELIIGRELNVVDLQEIIFPVIVKPTDSSGGRGVSVCHNIGELIACHAKALTYSKTKMVLLEPYVSGLELTIFYAIQNGNIVLTGMSDRYTRHKHGNIIPMPVAHILPSVYLTKYQNDFDEKVRAMFRSLELKNGMIFIQGFSNNGAITFYEMGYRLTGTQEYHILEHECGINTMKMMVNYSLTGQMSDQDISKHINPNYSKCYGLINFLVKPGTIGWMIGTEATASFPEVFNTIYEHRPGDTIPESAIGTLRQIAFRVFVKASSRHELALVMDRIHTTISILSDQGENMLLPPLDEFEVQYEA